MCGQIAPEGGVPAKSAFGPSFTDRDRLAIPTAEEVCKPCVWVMGSSPPDTLRMWSVMYRADKIAPPSNPKGKVAVGPRTQMASKADMTAIVDLLLDPPDCEYVVSIADSGQLHTAPFARVNSGRHWTVRLEREDVASTPEEFAEVLWHVTSLSLLGYVRGDIESLQPHPGKLAKYGLKEWMCHAEPLRRWRCSALLSLALIVFNKENVSEINERAGRHRAPRARDAFGSGDDAQRPDGQHQPDALVAESTIGAVGGGCAVEPVGPDGDRDGAEAGDPKPQQREFQLDLFG
jgi:hypothetical protein